MMIAKETFLYPLFSLRGHELHLLMHGDGPTFIPINLNAFVDIIIPYFFPLKKICGGYLGEM